MPRKETIKSERYRRGDSIRAVIKSVEITSRGPEIVISRSDNHFLYKLFEMEVPEIEDGIIEIRTISRYPGERAKIIVQSHDRRIDPVGACVGMRGSRIQAIVRELNNERIDIINYSEQSEILVSRALSPAKPLDLYLDDDRKYCIAIFDDDDLEFAIGRGGVNVNLAANVTEYRIDAFGKKEYERKRIEQETPLADIPDMPARAVKPLKEKGITTISELLNAEEEKLISRPRFYKAEQRVAENIYRILNSEAYTVFEGESSLIDEQERKVGLQLDPAQREAVEAALQHKVLIITGGPGTGKNDHCALYAWTDAPQNSLNRTCRPDWTCSQTYHRNNWFCCFYNSPYSGSKQHWFSA